MSYTRRKYIKSTPPLRVVKFTMGEPSEDYEYTVELVSQEKKAVSGRSLESARIAANRLMAEKYGAKGYFLRVCVYPHEIVRMHKFMGFAGADRLSQGMRRAFGKPSARAARVNNGQTVLSISTNRERVEDAKAALKRAGMKLPFTFRVEVRKRPPPP